MFMKITWETTKTKQFINGKIGGNTKTVTLLRDGKIAYDTKFLAFNVQKHISLFIYKSEACKTLSLVPKTS